MVKRTTPKPRKASLGNVKMRHIYLVFALVFSVQLASALLPSLPMPTALSRSSVFSKNQPSVAVSITATASKERRRPFRYYYVAGKNTVLSASITGDETTTQQQLSSDGVETKLLNSHAASASIISSHLQSASQAQSKDDVLTQQKEMECAERALVQWVEQYRGRRSSSSSSSSSSSENKLEEEVEDPPEVQVPDAQIFGDVIGGLLALPSSFAIAADADGDSGDDNEDGMNDKIRRTLLGKGVSSYNIQSEINKSDRSTAILDLMESFHEPTGALYDTLIASHGSDALECLSYLTIMEHNYQDGEKQENDESSSSEGDGDANDDVDELVLLQSKQQDSPFYQQAWKSAKLALQLLNRSEELYQETGQSSSRLPSISSYVTVMDVWKALAVGRSAEEEEDDENEKKRRDEALEVVRNLRQRRLQVYRSNDVERAAGNDGSIGYNILSQKVTSMAVEEVLDYAVNLLRESEPSYQLIIDDPTKIGTWHFNQVIFDLAKYPQPFSGPLAQDLMEYMMYMVKKETKKATSFSSQRRLNKKKKQTSAPLPNIPKPNVETINGVMKAWMVTPDYPDVARRAEAVLARLAIWQSEGALWGVHADTVSYNTAINCWKESGIHGAANRATEILRLMEDESTIIAPDVISYTTCIGAWADCSSSEPSAGTHAEEILMRMYTRSIAAGDELAPRPTTRCFNAVLLAFANGRQSGGGKRALDLLRFMEKLKSEGYSDLSPDTYTFNIVMKALGNCGERGVSRKANQLLQRMEDSFNKGDTSLKPDLLSYNTVLDAFSKEGDGKSAERFLQQMLNRGDDDLVSPDSHSYSAVLTAWSKSEDKEEAVRRAEELFDDIEGRYAAGLTDFRAETSVYNALINCWAKSGERKAQYRVTQILSLMEELGLQGGDSDVQPNSRTYCAVLDCLARSKNFKAYNMSLEILQRMEDFYSEGYESVRPCTRAYSIVLSTIARSRKRNKAVEAQELLHRMESEYRGGNSACRPNVYSYNAVLNAAAFSGRDEREQEEAFKVACLTFDELRMSDYLQPSHVSYGTFLKAIKHLMPEGDLRNDLVKGLFRKCCRDGLASDFVLKETAHLSGPDLYQSLLKGVTNDYGNLPRSWSANVRERDDALRS